MTLNLLRTKSSRQRLGALGLGRLLGSPLLTLSLLIPLASCGHSPRKTILLPYNPTWYERVWNGVDVDRTRITDNKNLIVHVGDRVDVVVGKVVTGTSFSKDDPRVQRDKLNGRGRRIWGVLVKIKGWF